MAADLEHWKAEAAKFSAEAKAARKELEEFEESSRLLEQELETEIKQVGNEGTWEACLSLMMKQPCHVRHGDTCLAFLGCVVCRS
jgi:hypothetical protein